MKTRLSRLPYFIFLFIVLIQCDNFANKDQFGGNGDSWETYYDGFLLYKAEEFYNHNDPRLALYRIKGKQNIRKENGEVEEKEVENMQIMPYCEYGFRQNKGNFIKFIDEDIVKIENGTIEKCDVNFDFKYDIQNNTRIVYSIKFHIKTSPGTVIKILKNIYDENNNNVTINCFSPKNPNQWTVSETDDRYLQKTLDGEFDFELIVNEICSDTSGYRPIFQQIIPKAFLVDNLNIAIDLSQLQTRRMTSRFPNFQKEDFRSGIYTWKNEGKIKFKKNYIIVRFTLDFSSTIYDLNVDFVGSESTDLLTGRMLFMNCPYSHINVARKTSSTSISDNFSLPSTDHNTYDSILWIDNPQKENVVYAYKLTLGDNDQLDAMYRHEGLLTEIGKNNKGNVLDLKDEKAPMRSVAMRILESEGFENAYDCDKIAILAIWVWNYVRYARNIKNNYLAPFEILYQQIGVCADYTHLLHCLCASLDLQLITMQGYGVGGSSAEKHSWSAFWCNHCNRFHYYDSTWGETYEVSDAHVPMHYSYLFDNLPISNRNQESITTKITGTQKCGKFGPQPVLFK